MKSLVRRNDLPSYNDKTVLITINFNYLDSKSICEENILQKYSNPELSVYCLSSREEFMKFIALRQQSVYMMTVFLICFLKRK